MEVPRAGLSDRRGPHLKCEHGVAHGARLRHSCGNLGRRGRELAEGLQAAHLNAWGHVLHQGAAQKAQHVRLEELVEREGVLRGPAYSLKVGTDRGVMVLFLEGPAGEKASFPLPLLQP